MALAYTRQTDYYRLANDWAATPLTANVPQAACETCPMRADIRCCCGSPARRKWGPLLSKMRCRCGVDGRSPLIAVLIVRSCRWLHQAHPGIAGVHPSIIVQLVESPFDCPCQPIAVRLPIVVALQVHLEPALVLTCSAMATLTWCNQLSEAFVCW